MQTYSIGEVAERTGFTASSLRYYEEHGLMRPAGRTPAGYRVYDGTVLTRLRFIRRAKELGCTLDEILELTGLLEGDLCEPVQERLHQLVSARIADAERRRDELVEFVGQLRAAAAHLGDQPAVGSCQDDCACMAAPVARNQHVTISCSLSPADIPSRVRDWEEVLTHVVSREWTASGALRLSLSDAVELGDVAALARAEQGCCSFFCFALTVDGRGVALEVSAPREGRDVLVSLFDEPA